MSTLEPLPFATAQSHSGTDTALPRKRVRTGCLNCRRKHKKCDEHKPVCLACSSKLETCEWPVPRLKKPARRQSLQHNAPHSSTTTVLPLSMIPPPVNSSPGVQQTFPVPSLSYPVGNQHIRRESSDLFSYSLASTASNNSMAPLPSLPSRVPGDDISQVSPRNYQLVSPIPMNRSVSVDNSSTRSFVQQEVDPLAVKELADAFMHYLRNQTPFTQQIHPALLLSNEDHLVLMENYITSIAPSLDIEAANLLFTEDLPVMMKDDPALTYAALALSSLSVGSHVGHVPLFRQALYELCRRVPEQGTSKVRDATVLLMTLFLYRHGHHASIVPLISSTIPTITFHITILRLTLSLPTLPPPSTALPHCLLPLLTPHALHDVAHSFSLLTKLQAQASPVLTQESTPFPTILISSHRLMHIHLLLHTAMLLLLSQKPLDVKLRSKPVAHYARQACALVSSNAVRVPWYASWCLYLVGRVFTHESEHAAVVGLMRKTEGHQSHWARKIEDYWAGTGDV